MIRSSRRLPLALGLIAGAVVALAACGSPSLPALTDPTEIITAGLTSTEAAKTVHVDATLDGSISTPPPDGLGSGTEPPPDGDDRVGRRRPGRRQGRRQRSRFRRSSTSTPT